jgi:hypothetical protein
MLVINSSSVWRPPIFGKLRINIVAKYNMFYTRQHLLQAWALLDAAN